MRNDQERKTRIGRIAGDFTKEFDRIIGIIQYEAIDLIGAEAGYPLHDYKKLLDSLPKIRKSFPKLIEAITNDRSPEQIESAYNRASQDIDDVTYSYRYDTKNLIELATIIHAFSPSNQEVLEQAGDINLTTEQLLNYTAQNSEALQGNIKTLSVNRLPSLAEKRKVSSDLPVLKEKSEPLPDEKPEPVLKEKPEPSPDALAPEFKGLVLGMLELVESRNDLMLKKQNPSDSAKELLEELRANSSTLREMIKNDVGLERNLPESKAYLTKSRQVMKAIFDEDSLSVKSRTFLGISNKIGQVVLVLHKNMSKYHESVLPKEGETLEQKSTELEKTYRSGCIESTETEIFDDLITAVRQQPRLIRDILIAKIQNLGYEPGNAEDITQLSKIPSKDKKSDLSLEEINAAIEFRPNRYIERVIAGYYEEPQSETEEPQPKTEESQSKPEEDSVKTVGNQTGNKPPSLAPQAEAAELS